jgi:hypothetical protein
LHLNHVARDLSDQRARNRRAHRNLANLEIGFVFANDLVGRFFLGVEVFDFDGCAEHDFAVGIDGRWVDDLCVAELAFDFLNAALNERLLLFGSVVLGVFADIALQTRLANGARGFDTIHRLQAMKLSL